jgi:hypothetical protein
MTPLDTPWCTPQRRKWREGWKGVEERKERRGSMGVWWGVAMDYFKYRYSLPCLTHVRPAGSHQEKERVWRGRGKGREKGNAKVAVRKANSLRPSYYLYGYPMMYASEEEEKGRVKRGRGKKREHGLMKHGLMAVSVMAARRASSLRPSYYLYGYPMMYAQRRKRREGWQGVGERKGRRGSMGVWRGAVMDSLRNH